MTDSTSPTAFSKQDLDAICKDLAPDARIFNPHRSALGLGCYDVNVIILALSKKGYDVAWYDKRMDPTCLSLDKIFGFILNVPNTPSDGIFGATLNYIPSRAQVWSTQKHWTALKRIGNYYYNLDSKLASPVCLGTAECLVQYLRQTNSIEQVEILIVISKCFSEDRSWFIKR